MAFPRSPTFTMVIFAATAGALVSYGLLRPPHPVEAADPEPKPLKNEGADKQPVPKLSLANNEQALRNAGQSYLDALIKGDVAALSTFWSAAAEYDDANGRHISGRDNIVAVIKEALAELKGYKIKGTIHSIKFLRPEVALEDGSMEYVAPDGSRSSSRYSVIWVNTDNRWLINSVRDLPTVDRDEPSFAYSHLAPLAWLIGEWRDADPTSGMSLSCTWAPNKCFLLMEYTISREGESLIVTQRLGWDPVEGAIRSWVFDSLGGFGEGIWDRDKNQWVVRSEGVLPEGGTGSAMNVYEFVDADHFVWHGKDRTVNGHPLADSNVQFTRQVAKP